MPGDATEKKTGRGVTDASSSHASTDPVTAYTAMFIDATTEPVKNSISSSSDVSTGHVKGSVPPSLRILRHSL